MSMSENLMMTDLAASPADDSFGSQKLEEGGDDPNKRSRRRSKKDKTGRNFVCGCGKQYLSYPALYTHLKTKHNGLQPVGTKNNLALKNKRGRPKKLEMRNDIQYFNGLFEESKSMPHFSNGLLNRVLTENNLVHTSVLERTDLPHLKIYGVLGKTDPILGFPVVTACDEGKPVFHPFYTIINHFKRNDTIIHLLAKNPCCDVIISLFLYYFSRLICEKFYLVTVIMFRNLREFLNEQAYDIIIKYLEKIPGQKIEEIIAKKKENKPFCEQETCEYMPLTLEDFVMVYLPIHCPEFDQNLAVDAMYDFCNWLLKNKFTSVKVLQR